VKVKATITQKSKLFSQQEIIVSTNSREAIHKVLLTTDKSIKEYRNKAILKILKGNI
jgi:hypothetical protein